jgi:hypothetical protein
MSNDPKDPPKTPAEMFPFDEMSTGETSSMLRRAHVMTGAPDHPLNQKEKDPSLKPMTGAQLAFRPSAPPRTGTQPALKPTTGTQPAFKPGSGSHPAVSRPSTGTQPAFKPSTGTQPAFRPATGTQPAFKPSTSTHAAFKPSAPAPEPEPPSEVEEAPPVFDAERLQAQIRAMSITDSALGRSMKPQKTNPRTTTTAVEDTFVKTKMKQAEAKVPDFDLDEDLG